MKKTKKKGALTPGLIAAAFLAALVIYGLLIYTEKKVTAKEETVSVVVAAGEIKKGKAISVGAEGATAFVKQIPVSLVPENAISAEESLENMKAVCDISGGTIITAQMLGKVNPVSEKMKEPVLIGFKAEDYYQTAGGRIRPGDRIHIYLQDEEGKVSLRWSNVYVADAFDSSGEYVEESGEGKTLRYNIYFEKRDVEEFYKNLDAKQLRIALATN